MNEETSVETSAWEPNSAAVCRDISTTKGQQLESNASNQSSLERSIVYAKPPAKANDTKALVTATKPVALFTCHSEVGPSGAARGP